MIKKKFNFFSNPIFFYGKSTHSILISISLIFGVYFRLKDINRDIVMQDEATSLLYFILPPLKSFSFLDYFMPNNHIFHTILANLSIQLFGNNEIAFRLPALIAGILAIGFIYWWVFLVSNSKEIAFISSLFLALSPISVLYSQNARGYSLLILFSIIALLSLYKILEKFEIKWAVVFVFSNILNMFTLPSSLYFVVSQFISLTIIYLIYKSNIYQFDIETESYLKKVSFKKIIFFSIITLLPFALLYIPILNQLHEQANAYSSFNLKDIVSTLIEDYFLLGFPWALFLCFLYGCWALCVKRKFWGFFLLSLFLLPFIVSFCVGYVSPSRAYLFCLPFFIFSFSIGFYEIIHNFFIVINKSSKTRLSPNLFAVISMFFIISVPLIIFLEKNYYPIISSFKHKNLRKHLNKIVTSNDLIFSPQNLTLDYYLGSLIAENASKILNSKKLNNIFTIKQFKTDRNLPPIEEVVYNLSKDHNELIKEFKDTHVNSIDKIEMMLIDNPVNFKLIRIVPTHIKKITSKDFLREWVQAKGSKKVDITNYFESNIIELNIINDNNSKIDDHFVYSNSFYKTSLKNNGFIFLTYALSYPNISNEKTTEPLAAVVLKRDKKNKVPSIQRQYPIIKNMITKDFSKNRLWYVYQKAIPLEKGDYDLGLGFWIILEKLENRIKQQNYLVRNLEAYIIEF